MPQLQPPINLKHILNRNIKDGQTSLRLYQNIIIRIYIVHLNIEGKKKSKVLVRSQLKKTNYPNVPSLSFSRGSFTSTTCLLLKPG